MFFFQITGKFHLRPLFLRMLGRVLWLKTTIQKQPSRCVLNKRCSENMQQIYRRTPMPKCDFNKVTLQLYWNRTSAWCSPVNLLHVFRAPFPKSTSGWLLLYHFIIPLSVVSKIFEKYVNDRLVDEFKKCGLCSNFKYGFRCFCSFRDLLVVVIDRIARIF